ncbi:hypothetical protein DM02DRAFT_627691 [Periconia macrospinosa]|uniref:Transmembrane protein n=1 Tax=Periconia macrospinosa TaxID=97972 RepID=A0A2V1DVT8_9PLEO|nr:hypothetical protein DM02DRAFT_627691 [Periconia macrospinosa]
MEEGGRRVKGGIVLCYAVVWFGFVRYMFILLGWEGGLEWLKEKRGVKRLSMQRKNKKDGTILITEISPKEGLVMGAIEQRINDNMGIFSWIGWRASGSGGNMEVFMRR